MLVLGTWGAIALTSPSLAMHPSPSHETTPKAEPQFRAIEQPLAVKIGVNLAGLGLIGAELWWFLLSKKRSTNSNS
nr:hypothetical protein [Leptolyngbya sp. FACHB-16]